MREAGPEWRRLGCAALLGAIVAFPAGMFFSTREPAKPEAIAARPLDDPVRQEMKARNPYPAEVLSDAHVVDQHRRTVKAMELSCRQTGTFCAEAEQARKYLLARDGKGNR